jgi:ketosteroid isomerase-like protein
MSVQSAHVDNAAVAAVHRYIEAFHKGDVAGMADCFAVPATILDGMAPHVWHGATATQDWYGDVLAEGEHLGAGGYRVTLDAPLHADINGEAAYVVSPATMTFQVRGTQVTQTGAVFTTALRQVAGDWRIAAWAWAKGRAG